MGEAEGSREHWSELVARSLEGRGGSHVIETGTSISGIPHIGNASDVIRGDAVRKSLSRSGLEARLVWVADDSDPLRKAPRGMEWLSAHLGKPVYDIPDLPECGGHKNFVDHFVSSFLEELEAFGVRPEHYSGRELYRSGKFYPLIKVALESSEEIVDILNKFREFPLPKSYLPWTPICKKCHRISTTHAKNWDGGDIVKYSCTAVSPSTQSEELKDVVGCGHKGESNIRTGEGKLPWRVEWAARWKLFSVTCEPFGKEHATVGGSYDTSRLISEKIFNWPTPVPVVYEFFTLNGQKISSSAGNVITLDEWLRIGEAEVLKFFMYKRIEKQRDIDLSKIPNMTDEYDGAEFEYFSGGGDSKLKLMYELSQVSRPERLSVPFTLCAVLAQVIPDTNMQLIQRKVDLMGYADYSAERLERRVLVARKWVERYGPDHLRFKLLDENAPVNVTGAEGKALSMIASELGKSWRDEDFHKRIYDIARASNLKPPELFKAIYTTLIGRERGPKAASFILALDEAYVKARFAKN
ncbi:MAG: lysine--tRNA ligase [Candidatus Altiarchaeota archaeon]